MKKVQRTPETNLAHYLEAGKSWETDEIAAVKRSERRAWRVATGAGILSALSVAAVAMLTPLKTVEPFVVRVDKNTGASDVVTLLKERSVSATEAVDKYWLSQYVNYREEYSEKAAYGNYVATKLLSTPNIAVVYEQQVMPSNPQSPTAIYGKKGDLEIKVTNVTFIGKNHAQVRYIQRETKDPGLGYTDTQWIATITYEYVNPPMTEQARLINPVGFRVTTYRKDPESGAIPTQTQRDQARVGTTSDAGMPTAVPAVEAMPQPQAMPVQQIPQSIPASVPTGTGQPVRSP